MSRKETPSSPPTQSEVGFSNGGRTLAFTAPFQPWIEAQPGLTAVYTPYRISPESYARFINGTELMNRKMSAPLARTNFHTYDGSRTSGLTMSADNCLVPR